MDFIVALLARSFGQVLGSFLHNWHYILASVVIAVALKTFGDAGRISAFLGRHRGAGIGVATAAAVGTPLCSCGTTAVVLGMMVSTMPWAPIVAFMVASPLSSPEGMVYTAGLFGWPFAIVMFVASVALGLTGGAVPVRVIAGSGTSIGAIAGALTIARWRVIAVVVSVLWIGAMAAGFACNFLLALRVLG
jgi:hypothetical protein